MAKESGVLVGEIKKETEKAILVEIEEQWGEKKSIWFGKAVVHKEDDTMVIPEWATRGKLEKPRPIRLIKVEEFEEVKEEFVPGVEAEAGFDEVAELMKRCINDAKALLRNVPESKVGAVVEIAMTLFSARMKKRS
ncbi:MAG: hypothetical protein OD815_001099 [Candidatus Alkanophagales archaeon MCA70_species_2]|nr:hypothetical protein [Candidatus Alkanophaga liquidiphilum]RLG39257.1 MAG: hypothetical protein DRN91_00185 [Candidatus Alkanophagales archaeon]